jgi:N6-adenosine-specific RNA methylase IME4
MSVDELCDMPIRDYAAEDSHLHLWTTNAFLFDAKKVIEAWGFEYRSCFVWVKPQIGIGNYWRVSHEFLLLGIRGDAKRFAERNHRSWGEFPRTKHSSKPEDIRLIIERVSPGPFLELFGRKPISGWTIFGNQIERRLFDG